ncbi:MAG: hypothetical protein NTW21_38565 [Verrucomicrobia bacterium]|nr:hypothetical protein [Verrucomicrobiota bacterium]
MPRIFDNIDLDLLPTLRANRCVISGFHSPVERECLRILLRGTSPVIICPARSLPKRIPPEWQAPLAVGNLLVVSIFPANQSRITAALAARRNAFVASLADEVWIAHVSDTGQLRNLQSQTEANEQPASPGPPPL